MQTSCVYGHPAGSKVHWTAHTWPDGLIFFHMGNFQVQNTPWCRSYSRAGLAAIFETTLSCSLKCMSRRERGRTGQGTRIYLQRPIVLSHSAGFHFVKKHVCKLILTGRELPCILDDMLNEVNVSTINAMSKMTLTWVKCSKRPCFLLAFLFVLFSPRELLQCGTSSPWRGKTPWFKQTVSSQWSPPLSKATRVSLPLLAGELCSQWRHHSLAGMLWVPAICLAGQDPTRARCFLPLLSWSFLLRRRQSRALPEDVCMPSWSATLGECCKGIVL